MITNFNKVHCIYFLTVKFYISHTNFSYNTSSVNFQSNRVQSSSSGSGAEEIQCAYPPDLSHYDCPSSLPVHLDEELPSQEEVMRKTEKITKNIQELHKSGQDGKHDRSVRASVWAVYCVQVL